MSTPNTSTIGDQEFGINLMSNATPSVGAAVSGSGSGAPSTGYNTADTFKFLSGDTIAEAAGPTNTNTFTVSYIANINGATPAGAYTTTLNYVATARF